MRSNLLNIKLFCKRKVKTKSATMTTKTKYLRRTRHNFAYNLLASQMYPTARSLRKISRRSQKSVVRPSPIALTLPSSSTRRECAKSATTRLVEPRQPLIVPIQNDQAMREAFASYAISKSTTRARSRLDNPSKVFKVYKYIRSNQNFRKYYSIAHKCLHRF